MAPFARRRRRCPLSQSDRHKRKRNDASDDAKRPEACWICRREQKLAADARQQSRHAVDAENLPPVFGGRAGVQPALDDNEHARETEPGQRPRRYPHERIDHKKVHERRGGGDRSESRKSSNVANPPYHSCGIQRSDDDAGPKARPDRADLRQGEALDFAADAENRALKRIARLHQPEAQEKGGQCGNCGRQPGWHLRSVR